MVFSRRRFLALSAAVALGACSSDSADGGDTAASEPGSTDTSAPDTSPADSTGPAGTTDVPQTTEAPGPALAADPFVLGVASGDPLPDSVICWTRLIGDDLSDTVPAVLEVATDEAFEDLVVSLDVSAAADEAHSVHAEATGLEPDTWYSYRFRAGGFTSPVGRTRTMPADDASPDSFVVGSASCQNYEDNFFAAHADIAASGIDCLFWLGDYIYEGAAQPLGTNGSVRSHETPEPTTLDEYRARYELYKRDEQLQAAHHACPWIITWDDHEVENNYAGEASQDTVPTEEFRNRRAAAYRAWWEHQPVRLAAPTSADYEIYRSARIGTLADISVLDTRQYRTDQACGDVTLSLEDACGETFDDTRTMTGADQEAWLFERLGNQGTVWNVLAQQVILANGTFGAAVLNYDQWDGYPKARERLLGHVAEAAVENLVVLTGDIHFAGVTVLRAPGAADAPIVGVEFVDTSISSAGNIDPSLESLVGSLGDVRAVELAHRGWTKHTITPKDWTAEFRIVADATKPESPSSTWKTFVVEAGVPDVTPLG